MKGYIHPLQEIERPAKIAVILATFIRKGKIEEVGGRGRKDPDFELVIVEDKLEMLKLTLASHKHFDAGVDYELIIVDNSTDDVESAAFIEQYAKENDIKLLKRPNTGFSFGAYQHAWKTFGDTYDYYLFHEQDILPVRDGWLRDVLIKFHSHKDIGAVGNIIEGPRSRDYFDTWAVMDPAFVGTEYWDSKDFMQMNLDGMFMFASSNILKKCGLQIYEMKLTKEGDYESWDLTPGVNELFYQHPILNAGYTLEEMRDAKTLYTWGIQYIDFPETKGMVLAPMMHAQIYENNPYMKKYFDWYIR